MSEDSLTVVFCKAPVAGQVKTRLAASSDRLDVHMTADLYRAFLLDIAERLAHSDRTVRLSAVGDLSHPTLQTIAGMGIDVLPQPDGDLGERMDRVVTGALGEGFEKVTIVGSDSPTMPLALFELADAQLEESDVALAPSFDGGYVLLASRVPLIELRSPTIRWSSEWAMMDTCDSLRGGNHLVGLLPFWYDVDQLGDLKLLSRHLLGWAGGAQRKIAPRTAEWIDDNGFGGRGR